VEAFITQVYADLPADGNDRRKSRAGGPDRFYL